MKNLNLEKDEVLFFTEQEIIYRGSMGDELTFDEVSLTSKRIVCFGKKKKEEIVFEIPLSKIKRYKNQLQVDKFDDPEYGECLRIQTEDGIELFLMEDYGEDQSFKESVKNFFGSGKKKENSKIKAWIEKINEILLEEPSLKKDEDESNVDRKEEADKIGNSITSSNSNESFIACPECGERINSASRFCPLCGASTVKPKIVEVEKVVEIIKCRKCGAKISDNDRFCPECGAPVIEEEKKEEPKQEEVKKEEPKKKNTSKCPICGEFLPSNAMHCPACGHEIRGREVVNSVKEFAKEVASIEDENKKIEVIKMFPIPNNKEDITEFMYLAITNFDAKYYATNKQGESVASAWKIKIEQCYKKAKVMFDPSDMVIIEKLYKEASEETKKIKKTKLIMFVSGLAAIILGVILMCLAPRSNSEDGNSKLHPLAYVAFAILAVGIIVLVLSLRRKKSNKEIEEAKIAKANKKNNKNND